ncbi:MAG: thiolase family protein [Thermoleophilia bacterium]
MSAGPAIVVAARRTPIARLDGELAPLPAEALAATVLAALVRQTGLAADRVDDVILATAAGPGGNLARRAALDAGLAPSVPGLTIDRQCGGGLDAIVLACRLVEAGAGELYLAGGVESASTSPLRAQEGRDGGLRGRRFFPRRMFAGGGHDDPGMAESAEIIAAEWGVSRARQDALAARSHRAAAAARDEGAFAAEIVPCPVPGGRPVDRDGCPRPTLTAERLARFPAIVAAGGTVTAGNSSQIADGAAAAVVASPRVAERLGLGGLRHVASATAGVDPRVCGIGAVAAVRRLGAAGAARPAAVAVTEAFASQTLATIDELGLDPETVNRRGGAIALGHPWAASGAVQVVRLAADLAPGERGLAMAAIAGGMGTAAVFGRA